MRIRPLIFGLLLAISALGAPGLAMAAKPAPQVRVDQVGYTSEQSKVAWLLAARRRGGAKFRVETRDGTVVLEGRVGRTKGPWSDTYRSIHPIDISSLQDPGEYRIVVRGDPDATSPWFRVGTNRSLVDGLVADVVAFFGSQRDGPDVIAGDLDRRPSHLNDATAALYEWPRFRDPDSDVITGDLKPLGGEVDLVGGWFDAGDYLKFTHTTAYADALLWAMQRELGSAAPDTLAPEARFGLDWLARTWHPDTSVLDLQVGIGAGDRQGTYLGDHDLWRLPEVDDALTGDANRYLAHRPAFRANAAGAPVPPNLAGRIAAAFGLAAQVTGSHRSPGRRGPHEPRRAGARRREDPGRHRGGCGHGTAARVLSGVLVAGRPGVGRRGAGARGTGARRPTGRCLAGARARIGRWGTSRTRPARTRSTSTTPARSRWPTWCGRCARHPRPCRRSARRCSSRASRAQLDRGVARAADDPFGAGFATDEFDGVPHAFGLMATALLYGQLTGDDRYAGFAAQQRDWVFGANAWGASMMVGAGSRFPNCPAHVVANLSGRQDGTPPILRGAVVNGPNDAELFAEGVDEPFDEANDCPVDGKDRYAAFTGQGSRFVDDVSAWQTVEPALDFSAIAGYALALAEPGDAEPPSLIPISAGRHSS